MCSQKTAAASKPDHAVMAATMPGIMRRMRAPARTLIVNAVSVQAAKSVPRRPDICGASGLFWPSWSIGW